MVFRCTYWLHAASLENFSYFYLIKMKNLPHSKPYFGLFWPLKLIKTLFTYFYHKIKPKPSIDGTLSPNTIFISKGLYCTQCPRTDLNKRFLPKPMTTTGWKGTPYGVKIMMNWNPPWWIRVTKKFFFETFFRLKFFFSGKKKFRAIRKFLKFFDFQKW